MEEFSIDKLLVAYIPNLFLLIIHIFLVVSAPFMRENPSKTSGLELMCHETE